MSDCIDELTAMMLADGELTAEQTAQARAHCEACGSCRALVADFVDEGTLLRDFFKAEGFAPAVEVAAHGLGWRWSLAGCASVLASALTWAVIVEWSGVLADFYPLTGWLRFAVREMTFSIGHWLSGIEVMMLMIQLVLSSILLGLLYFLAGRGLNAPGAPLGRSALLARRLGGGLGLFVWLCASTPASAADYRRGERVVIPEGETVEDTLFVGGESVTISGMVDGDCFVAAENFVLDGVVRGNIFAATGEFEMRGNVTGSVHWVGEQLELEGEIGGQLYTLGATVEIDRKSRIAGEVFSAGESLSASGEVARDLRLFGSRFELHGQVGRKVQLAIEGGEVFDGAQIGGDLEYHSERADDLKIHPGAQIGGETRHKPAIDVDEDVDEDGGSSWLDDISSFLVFRVMWIVSGLALAWALFLRVPGFFAQPETNGQTLGRSIGTGFLLLVVPPVAAGLLAATGIAMPLGAILLVVYLLALGLSVTVSCHHVGQLLLRRPLRTHGDFLLNLFCGYCAFFVAAALPYVGGWVVLAGLIFGLGAIYPTLLQAWHWRAVADDASTDADDA